MNDMTQTRDRLVARRAELIARMTALDAELDSHDARDWEELATERTADEALESLGLSAESEVARIDAALRRLAEGDYGFCVRCGAAIAPARLALLPETPLCAVCATQGAKGSVS